MATHLNSREHTTARSAAKNMRGMISGIKRNSQYRNIKKAAAKVPDLINRYPVQSLVTGLAVGFLVGKLLTKGTAAFSQTDNV